MDQRKGKTALTWRLTRAIGEEARVEVAISVGEEARLEARERNTHFQIELLTPINSIRLVLIRLGEVLHGLVDRRGCHGAETGSEHLLLPAEILHFGHRVIHNFKAYVLALSITVKEEHKIVATARF